MSVEKSKTLAVGKAKAETLAAAVVAVESPTLSVAELLAESMRLHNSARPVSKVKRAWEDVAPTLRQACALRQQADAADPDHTDPAWTFEQKHTPNGTDTHEAMMAFYRDCGVDG